MQILQLPHDADTITYLVYLHTDTETVLMAYLSQWIMTSCPHRPLWPLSIQIKFKWTNYGLLKAFFIVKI